jgi:hypothetical protein
LEEEEVGLIEEVGEVEGSGGEEVMPLGADGEEVIADGAIDVSVEVVDVVASREVHDEEAAVGFECLGEVKEGGGLVTEVGEGVEAEDRVVESGAEGIGADIAAEEVSVDIFGFSAGDHLGSEVDSGDAAGGDLGGEPGGRFPGTTADFEECGSGPEVQEGRMMVEAVGHGLAGGFFSVPVIGEVVEEGDA